MRRFLAPDPHRPGLLQADLPLPISDAEITLDDDPTEEIAEHQTAQEIVWRPAATKRRAGPRTWRHLALTALSAAAATLTTVQVAGVLWLTGPTTGAILAAPVALLLWAVTAGRVTS